MPAWYNNGRPMLSIICGGTEMIIMKKMQKRLVRIIGDGFAYVNI